jgi:hypothetical protein
MRKVLAGRAKFMHVALRREGVIRYGREVAPGLFPVFVTMTDGMTRGGIGSAAFARVHAHDRLCHP